MVVESSNDVLDSARLARVFKTLGEPNRLAVFQLLRSRCCVSCGASGEDCERTIGDLARPFDLALSTVSHHVKELRESGLVLCEKKGTSVYCSVNHELLGQLEAFFSREEP